MTKLWRKPKYSSAPNENYPNLLGGSFLCLKNIFKLLDF